MRQAGPFSHLHMDYAAVQLVMLAQKWWCKFVKRLSKEVGRSRGIDEAAVLNHDP